MSKNTVLHALKTVFKSKSQTNEIFVECYSVKVIRKKVVLIPQEDDELYNSMGLV